MYFPNRKILITNPVYHEENAYGNNPDKEHGKDTIFITVFRKK